MKRIHLKEAHPNFVGDDKEINRVMLAWEKNQTQKRWGRNVWEGNYQEEDRIWTKINRNHE